MNNLRRFLGLPEALACSDSTCGESGADGGLALIKSTNRYSGISKNTMPEGAISNILPASRQTVFANKAVKMHPATHANIGQLCSDSENYHNKKIFIIG